MEIAFFTHRHKAGGIVGSGNEKKRLSKLAVSVFGRIRRAWLCCATSRVFATRGNVPEPYEYGTHWGNGLDARISFPDYGDCGRLASAGTAAAWGFGDWANGILFGAEAVYRWPLGDAIETNVFDDIDVRYLTAITELVANLVSA